MTRAPPSRPAWPRSTRDRSGMEKPTLPPAPSTPAVDRDLAGQVRRGPASRPGRPPLMIRCCEDNRRSDGSRRPQRRRGTCPVAGAVRRGDGPGRGPVRSGGAAAAGQGVRARPAGGPAPQELLDDRRARRRPQPRRDAAPAGRAVWDDDAVRDDVRAFVVEHLGDPEAVLVVDETGDLKKGTGTVGVQRQYTGTAGRIENAQVAVYLVYASRRRARGDRPGAVPAPGLGRAILERLRAAGVPDQVGFATKPELATAMVRRALDAGVPAAWVTGDEVYGADPGLRATLEARGVGYVLAVACDHPVRRRWRQPPRRRPAHPCPGAGLAAGLVWQGRQRPPLLRLGVHPPGPPTARALAMPGRSALAADPPQPADR